MLGGNPMLMPTAPGMMPPAPGMMMPPAPGMMPPGPPGFGPGSIGTPMEQAMLLQMADMNRQRYGGTRDEDVLIESFNVRGASRITVPMALAMRSSIPGEVSGDRAACDVKLRDTVMPGGIARKVEMVAAVLYDKEFFPGEPQIALFMAGRWSRADGFRPYMCQKMRGWAKRRSHAEDASIDVAAAGGTRGRAAIRNLPEFPAVTHMEPYENMVEGLLQLAEHAPDGMVFGMREFFSIQRTHYQACGDLDAMNYATLYTDLLDRFDEHAKAVHRMGIGVLTMVPALHALPTELASTMLLREQQLKSILTALRSSGVQTQAAIAAVVDDKQKPPAKPPTGETRKEKREREAAERKAKQAAAAELKKPPPKKSPVKTEPGTGGAPGGGGAGARTGACFNFMRGACSHGATCRFSHDASVIDAARVSYQPQGAREIWAQKWSQRPSPGRAGDPPARVNGNTPIAGAWVLAEDRWSICEQTEGKCFLRHVKCQADCACALCQAPGGKKWPKMVAARVKPADWKGEE